MGRCRQARREVDDHPVVQVAEHAGCPLGHSLQGQQKREPVPAQMRFVS